MTTFSELGLDPDILRAVTAHGYTIPTPIQLQAIPAVLTGQDLLAGAQTGTGKTAGFTLPLLHRLLAFSKQSPATPGRRPIRALILTPTRELAAQVEESVRTYGKFLPLTSGVIFGGVGINPQIKLLKTGVDTLVATPGRLLDHISHGTIDLTQIKILVLDEADRMLDMGFLPDLQRIINLLPKQRQSLMFSATFSQEIKKLAGTFLRNPQTIEVARSNATAENVTQILYTVAEDEKRDAVSFIIRERNLKQVIVFSNTKIGASRLAVHLAKTGVKASAIHGDKSQSERMAALEAFKRGEIEVLVATDVAARGLDIAELPCVINYDLPHSAEDYVHRIGRTGRAGAKGDAISLAAEKDDRYLADIEKLIKQKITRVHLAGFVAGKVAESHRSREPREPRSSSYDDVRHNHRTTQKPYTPNAPKVDPWFLQPYQPAASTLSDKPAVVKPGPGKAAPKRAALLGGSSKT